MPEKYQRIARKKMRKLQPAVSSTELRPARLGLADGSTVKVPGHKYMVWVTYFDGTPIKVLNQRVPNSWGKLVLVGFDPVQFPTRRQVLGLWDVYPDAQWAGSPEHADQHGWQGEDPLWVTGEQFLPALVIPVPGQLKVDVFPVVCLGAHAWKIIRTVTRVDVSASVPTKGARYTLLVVDASGLFSLRNGSTVSSRAALVDGSIPLPTAGDNVLCALILYAGMSGLEKRPGFMDILDLRFSKGHGGGSAWSGVPGRVVITDGSGNLATSPGFTFDSITKSLSLGDNPPPPASRSGSFHQVSDQEHAGHFLWSWGNAVTSLLTGWRARGTKAAPSAVQMDDDFFTINGAGYDGSLPPQNAAVSARMRFAADENFTATAHGTRVEIDTTPAGSLARRITAIFKSNGSLDLPAAGSTYNVAGSPHSHWTDYTIAALGGVTQLNGPDKSTYVFVGTTGQTPVLPDVATIKIGHTLTLVNNTTVSISPLSYGSVYEPGTALEPGDVLTLVCVSNVEAGSAWVWLKNYRPANTLPLPIGTSLVSGSGATIARIDHVHTADHANLANKGINTHAAIDTTLAAHTSKLASIPTLAWGTYLPTLTNVANIDASTSSICQYMRVGNVVTVGGHLSIDPTVSGAVRIDISLPIASAFTNSSQLGGTMSDPTGDVLRIISDSVNARARCDGAPADVASRSYGFSFIYLIV